jgi:NTP pyrophosphatase (non-canonical NTP hydrolase)
MINILTKKSLKMYSDYNFLIDKYILEEVLNQYNKWGFQKHSNQEWLSILMEEIGESAKEVNENNIDNLIDELLQSGAVIFSWLINIIERYYIDLDRTKVNEQFNQYFNFDIKKGSTVILFSDKKKLNKGD